jgi:uncharacterized protein YecE (DUF72 family)
VAGRVVVGTGGWSVPSWYPKGPAAGERLRSFAERLEAVEVDASFYALPSVRTVARWAELTPDGFTFDVKLHRLLSRHAAPLSSLPRDLRDDVELTERGRVVLDERLQTAMCARTLEVFAPLHAAGRLTAFLLQLTPAFHPPDHRLDELDPVIQGMAPVPVAVELRHRGWLRDLDATLAWFRDAGAAFVCVDAPAVEAPVAMPPVDAVTREDLAYLRAHGRNAEGYLRGRSAAERFEWRYSDEELDELAGRVRELAASAERVECIFANGTHALEAALRMRELLA